MMTFNYKYFKLLVLNLFIVIPYYDSNLWAMCKPLVTDVSDTKNSTTLNTDR